MSTRRLVILAALTLTLALAAALAVVLIVGRGNNRALSLQQVQAAFARAGMPLPCVTEEGRPPSRCGAHLLFTKGTNRDAHTSISHLIAIASTKSLKPSKLGIVEIWDGAEAVQLLLRIGPGGHRLAAANVLYDGPQTSAARHAMASLRAEVRK